MVEGGGEKQGGGRQRRNGMTESERSSGGLEVKDEDLQRGTHTDKMHRSQSTGRTVHAERVLGVLGTGLLIRVFNNLPLPHLNVQSLVDTV